jgi:hypothetical protein
MNTGRLVLAAVVGVLCIHALQARYIRPEIEQVPVGRLVENLEKAITDNPKDANLRYNLARVHGMAYALKIEEVPVNKRTPGAAWFGYEAKYVPFELQPTKDQAKFDAAIKHLRQAMKRYEETIQIAPDHHAARLGLAWTTEQGGDKKRAVELYRDVIERGWAKERALTHGPLGGHYITAEAADYLIPLLDAKKDATEIADLKERKEKLNKLPRPVTPIAIPMRPGLAAKDLLDANAKLAFDVDGSGLDRRWTWITPNAGWLVYDPQGKGDITSGLQLMGNATFGLRWQHGYEPLAALDDNRDGSLRGDELKHLAVWCDRNGDGRVQPGEMQSLDDLGIIAISCRSDRNEATRDAPLWSPDGITFRDGSTRPSFDLILQQR